MRRVGIIGAGNIGAAVGYLLRGFDVKLAFRGSARTQLLLQSLGLSDCATTDVQSVLDTSDVMFLCVKPQDFAVLGNLRWPRCLYVNMMAAVPFSELEHVTGSRLGSTLFHLHTGPHDLLRARKGVAKLFPACVPGDAAGDTVLELCSAMGLELLPPFQSETEVPIFGVLVCAPNLFTMMQANSLPIDEQVLEQFQAFVTELGASHAVADWAFSFGIARLQDMTWDQLPEEVRSGYANGVSEYVSSLATRGGITEAIFKAMQQGRCVKDALHLGHDRYIELLAQHANSRTHARI